MPPPAAKGRIAAAPASRRRRVPLASDSAALCRREMRLWRRPIPIPTGVAIGSIPHVKLALLNTSIVACATATARVFAPSAAQAQAMDRSSALGWHGHCHTIDSHERIAVADTHNNHAQELKRAASSSSPLSTPFRFLPPQPFQFFQFNFHFTNTVYTTIHSSALSPHLASLLNYHRCLNHRSLFPLVASHRRNPNSLQEIAGSLRLLATGFHQL